MCKELPHMICKAKSPRSPFRRRLREIPRPRLSRKIVSSARVNLNGYWSKFENVSPEAPSSSIIDNEINENLANEISELGK